MTNWIPSVKPYAGKAINEGKQQFMASAAEFIRNERNIEVTRNSTLLVDDDEKNVFISLNNLVRAVKFDPNNPNSYDCTYIYIHTSKLIHFLFLLRILNFMMEV